MAGIALEQAKSEAKTDKHLAEQTAKGKEEILMQRRIRDTSRLLSPLNAGRYGAALLT